MNNKEIKNIFNIIKAQFEKTKELIETGRNIYKYNINRKFEEIEKQIVLNESKKKQKQKQL